MDRWKEELVRLAILFTIALVLVAGFWVHREFYQFGFYLLLVVGGSLTFVLMVAARYAVSGRLSHRRPRGTLTLPLEDGERLLQRRATLAVLPVDTALPPVGSVAAARFETGAEFGRYRLVDAYRKMLGDLDADEVRRAGFRTLDELRHAWQARGPWRPEAVVVLARLEPLPGGAG